MTYIGRLRPSPPLSALHGSSSHVAGESVLHVHREAQLCLVRVATVSDTNTRSVGTIFASAFAFGIGFDTATQMWWDKHNKGVCIRLG